MSAAKVRRYLEDAGELVATDREIATASRCSLSTARRAIADMVSDGSLEIVRHRRRKATYRAKLSAQLSVQMSAQLSVQNPDLSAQLSVQRGLPLQTPILPSETHKKESKKTPLSPPKGGHAAPKAVKGPKPKLPFPEDWQPDDADLAFAAKCEIPQPQVALEVQRIIGWHHINAKLSASPKMSWRTWCLKKAEWRERDLRQTEIAENQPSYGGLW